MINRTIRTLNFLFVVLFLLLAGRLWYVQLGEGADISSHASNPRHGVLQAGRGRILATDGTILAYSDGERRIYPFGASLAHSVGYVSTRYGASGIEDAYDAALSPPDISGDPIGQFEEIRAALQGRTPLAHGADVVTTIVPQIQQELFAKLSQHSRAAGIVLDPRSGAILAIASVPSFDPNDVEALFPALSVDETSPLLDRATEGLYPPGSTFKIFTASAALESGTVTPDSRFEDPGYLVIGDTTLHDNEGEATGYQDVTTAFALSSNVDFAQIALKVGVDAFYQYLARFDIGGSLDFQLPSSRSSVPPKDEIVPGELAQMGFGQGALLVTPLQMALIAATVANGGNEPRPFIVRQIVRGGIAAGAFPSGTLASPISADTADEVKKMMIAVVERGTGTVASLPNVLVAGKTGTATNPHGAAHSWFVCFAPADAPRVVVAIVVENAGYGATVAAPIARDVLQAALQSTGSAGT
ncbi:MAG TPA: penicillin-binding transpeptidase domain-containing protein [Candidatus Tyrphobacter sp.]